MDLTPPTRQSLLSRLRSWDNQDSWYEFFELYSRLIYGVARRSGLAESEAEEVVQETVIAVAKEMPGFKYDRLKGSFKGWLLVITRRRIADQLRRRYRHVGPGLADIEDPQVAAELARVTDGSELESVWDDEWQTHLRAAALERVKRRVRPEHFQMFDLYVLRGWSVKRVARALGVSSMQVYLARHRIGREIRKELAAVHAKLN